MSLWAQTNAHGRWSASKHLDSCLKTQRTKVHLYKHTHWLATACQHGAHARSYRENDSDQSRRPAEIFPKYASRWQRAPPPPLIAMNSLETVLLFIIPSNIENPRPPPTIVTLMSGKKKDHLAIKDLKLSSKQLRLWWDGAGLGLERALGASGRQIPLGYIWVLLLWIMCTLCVRSTSSADEKPGMQTAGDFKKQAWGWNGEMKGL